MKMFSLLSIETASNSQEEAIIAQAFFSFLKWVFLDLDSAKEKKSFRRIHVVANICKSNILLVVLFEP